MTTTATIDPDPLRIRRLVQGSSGSATVSSGYDCLSGSLWTVVVVWFAQLLPRPMIDSGVRLSASKLR